MVGPRSCRTLGSWTDGRVDPHTYGPMERQDSGSEVPRDWRPVGLRDHGVLVPWLYGTVGLWAREPVER